MNCVARFVLLSASVAAAAPLAAPATQTGSDADRPARLASARTYAEHGEYDKVIETLEALRDGGDDYEVSHLLGQAYFQTDNLPEARRCLQAAIEQKPKSAPDHCLLADTYLRQEKFALAAESYETAWRLGLDVADLHYGLATAYYKLKNYTGRIFYRTVEGGSAGRIVKDCYLIEPAPSQADRFIAAPQSSAIYHLQKAHDAGIDTPEAHLLHVDIWLRTGRYAQALAIFETLEERVDPPDRAEYYFAYARACLGADDRQGYLDRLEKAIALDPKTYRPRLVDAYRQVAARCNAEGDLQDYIRYLKLAVGEAPESHNLRYALGNALFEAGRQAGACRQWQITLELQPDHPDRTRMLELIRKFKARSRPDQ
ncbi:MAG: tetratricopeptide repeat protein [Planctomycetota bacterium]